MHKARLIVSGLVFLLLALVHLYRVINPFPIIIGTNVVPEAASYIGLIIFGLLAIWDLVGCCCCCCGCSDKCSCNAKSKIDKK